MVRRALMEVLITPIKEADADRPPRFGASGLTVPGGLQVHGGEALNRLFWWKLSAAGRCWRTGTLLPYKLSETIHSRRSSAGSESPDSITAETQHGGSGGRPRPAASLFFVSPSEARRMFSHGRGEMKGNSASCSCNPILESNTGRCEGPICSHGRLITLLSAAGADSVID